MGLLFTSDRVRVRVSTMPGEWDTASEPGGSRTNTKIRTDAMGPQKVLTSRQDHDDLTLTRVWDSERDPAIWAELTRGNAYEGTSISLVHLDADGVPVGAPDTYVRCAVQAYKRGGADANANGSEPVKLTVTWTVGGKA